jgi:hypothetical protein
LLSKQKGAARVFYEYAGNVDNALGLSFCALDGPLGTTAPVHEVVASYGMRKAGNFFTKIFSSVSWLTFACGWPAYPGTKG